jgi:hypothetical protein
MAAMAFLSMQVKAVDLPVVVVAGVEVQGLQGLSLLGSHLEVMGDQDSPPQSQGHL